VPTTKPNRDEIKRFDDLTIELLMQGPGLIGTSPSRLRFSADGNNVFFRWQDPLRLDSLNAIDPLTAYENYLALEHETGVYQFDVTRGSIVKLADEVADTLVSRESAWNYKRNRHGEIRDGDVYLVDLTAGRTRRVTATLGREHSIQISRSGDVVYFVRNDNLFSMQWSEGPIRQLTNLKLDDEPVDPQPSDQRGFLIDQQKALFRDFQREEEEQPKKRPAAVYLGADWEVESILISPSGRYAAVELFKEPSGARKPIIPHFVTESGYMETTETRPKVDDLRESSHVRLVDLEGDSLVALRIDDGIIANLRSWSPIDDVLLIRGITDDYKARYFYSITPDDRTPEGDVTPMILDEYRDDAWVGGPGFYSTGEWLNDGSGIFYLSEEGDGYSHLYTVSMDGTRHTRLTSGEWEVYQAHEAHDGSKWFLISNEGDAGSHRLWAMNSDGVNRRLLTDDVGQYRPLFSPDETKVALLRSTLNEPPELYLYDMASETLDGPVTQSTTDLFRSFAWVWPKVVTIKASDGGRFRAHLFEPSAFGKRPNRAGVVFIHGAGYLQNVMNWWSYYYREYMFNHLLAMNGYTVLNVDFRGSAGYGRESRVAIHRHMGGRDLDDVIDGAKYLMSRHGVGKDKVGVYGGSYGGFLTIMALFKYPDVIKCGGAIRSVTDWAHYNHWYTSRILGLPKDDPEAFERSSPINFADGFEGGLLMLHGLVDDNVLAADVLRLSQVLIELGKEDWELMLYPMEAHAFQKASSWTDEYRRIFKLFESKLAGKHDE